MIIRPATLSDLGQLLELAMEQASNYPELKPDRDKIRALIIDGLSTAKHWAHVVDEGNRITGALFAFTTENVWAQRQNSAVMFWVSKTPGAGATMLRRFRDWVKTRRAIRVAGFAPDIDLDPRVWQLAERIGFQRYGGAYLLYSR